MRIRLLMVVVALLATITAIQAEAGVTRDIRSKMTSLLGHDPKVINVMDAAGRLGLDNKSTEFQPWSGSYWPDINGGIANHYRTHSKVLSGFNFMLRYSVAKLRLNYDFNKVVSRMKAGKWNAEEIGRELSPAEKYDLLLGDLSFSFTRAVMEEADFRQKYRLTTKRTGSGDDSESAGDDNTPFEDDLDTYSRFDDKVEYRYWRSKGNSLAYWSGICDGWSPASIYLPRPIRAVTVTGALGHRIAFYPDDLKALGSYLFARTNTPYFSTMNYQFAGRKCDESGTPDDNSKGRVKDIRCNDLDAGVFHLTLLNRIGMDRMGFVMDIDNNLKINNHPVSSYRLKYFNPATGKEGTLARSMVDISTVKDAYRYRRNPQARYLVGVKADVTYMYYIWPEENREDSTDSASKDKMKSTEYTYDLELDANYNILGGEWGDRSKENGVDAEYADQPDFLWMSAPEILPYSEMSLYAIAGVQKNASVSRPFGNTVWAWDGRSALPSDWLSAARADLTWSPPVPGEKVKTNNVEDVVPASAKNSVLKSAQPLSHIVYYLFDQARAAVQTAE
jgi:hypothetical protein